MCVQHMLVLSLLAVFSALVSLFLVDHDGVSGDTCQIARVMAIDLDWRRILVSRRGGGV